MAIPNAYLKQIQPEAISQKESNASRNQGISPPMDSSKISHPKSCRLINLHKKRRYIWLGLIYVVLFCFAKCNGIVEKWEANVYKFMIPGVSLSVGKKSEAASIEKPPVEKPASEKPLNDTTKPAPGQKDKAKSAPEKDKESVAVTNSGISTMSAGTVPGTSAVPINGAAKSQAVVTLPTDSAGFDPLSTSSPKEVELLFKLAARRQDVEKREALLKEREIAVSIIEKQQKDKIAELTKLKETIEVLLKKTDKNSQEQFGNLVKIYEGMKPKHAAQVFERIDVAVLKELIPLMSQRKVSSILDQMSIVKAKELSLVLISNKNPFAKLTPNAPKK